jgi:hypothetical protein
MPTESAVQQIWLASLAVYFVVVVVVAAMLTAILSTARQIHSAAAAIWTVGQKVANNTIHLALLLRTNHLAARILDAARGAAEAVAAVERHARDCPHCPTCVTGAAPGERSL